MFNKKMIWGLFIYLFFSVQSIAYANNFWNQSTIGVGNDKLFHFVAGATINSALSTEKVSWIQRKIIVIAAGAIKETIDHNNGGKWDFADFGCTVLGSLIKPIHFVYYF